MLQCIETEPLLHGRRMVQLVLALYLATILSFKTKFGNMFKGFMFFPYLISGIAIGFIFKFFYTRGSYSIPYCSGVDLT